MLPEWKRLRDQFTDEARRWAESMRTPREANELELNVIVGTIAHLAYHIGAIRQIDRESRRSLKQHRAQPQATDRGEVSI